MNLGIVLAVFCIIVGISYGLSDLAGLLAFISLGFSLALMENIGNDNLLMFIDQQGVPSIKVISAWLTLFIFIIMFSYKIVRDRNLFL